MPMYSYDLQNVKRDLSDTMNTVVKDEPIFISKFPRVGDAKANKHEWLEDQIGGRGITATAATSGGVSSRPRQRRFPSCAHRFA